jgi:hypothetical protein
MKKAGIALDDRKLLVFRKRLTDAGFAYEDGGAPSPGVTLLTVKFQEEDFGKLSDVIAKANAECAR